jgi:hypothetical protein
MRPRLSPLCLSGVDIVIMADALTDLAAIHRDECRFRYHSTHVRYRSTLNALSKSKVNGIYIQYFDSQ